MKPKFFELGQVLGLFVASVGLIHAVDAPAQEAESFTQAGVEDVALNGMFMLMLLIETEAREGVQSQNSVVRRMGIDESAAATLMQVATDAKRQHLSFQKSRITQMCANSSEFQTKERLAEEYVSQTASFEADQRKRAAQALTQLPEPTRSIVVSWIRTWFVPNVKPLGLDARQAILGSPTTAGDLLQKFCANLETI